MSPIRRYVVSFATDSDGNGSATISDLNGELLAIQYLPGSSPWATGATLSIVSSVTAQTVYSKASIGTSAFIVYPRRATDDTAGATIVDTNTDPLDHEPFYLAGSSVGDGGTGEKLTFTVSSGGNTTTSSVAVLIR